MVLFTRQPMQGNSGSQKNRWKTSSSNTNTKPGQTSAAKSPEYCSNTRFSQTG